MADVAEDQMVRMVQVNWKGKTLQMTEADAQELRGVAMDAVRPYVDSLSRMLALNVKTLQKYRDMGEISNNALKAISLVVVLKAGGIQIPSSTLADRASAAIKKLESVVSAGKLADLQSALAAAEAAINALGSETEGFLKKLTGTSSNVYTTLSVATAAGFAVFGVVAGAAIAGPTVSAAAAAAISAATAKALEAEITMVAKMALGQPLEPWEMVTFNVDVLVAAITGGISGAVKPEILGPIARTAAGKIAPRVTSMTAEQIEKLILKYLTGAGAGVATTALNQVLETLAEMVKKGRVPTQKELEGYLLTATIGILTGGFMQVLELGNTKMTKQVSELFESKLVPDAVKKIAAAAVESKKIKEIAGDVAKKLIENAMKLAGAGVANSARGNESADGVANLGTSAVTCDPSFKRLVEAEVTAQLKKRSIAVK